MSSAALGAVGNTNKVLRMCLEIIEFANGSVCDIVVINQRPSLPNGTRSSFVRIFEESSDFMTKQSDGRTDCRDNNYRTLISRPQTVSSVTPDYSDFKRRTVQRAAEEDDDDDDDDRTK